MIIDNKRYFLSKRLTSILAVALVLILFTAFCMTGCRDNGGNKVIDPEKNENYDPDKGIDRTDIKNYIVKNGSSDYSIVISATATVSERYAAMELEGFIRQASGVSLKLIDESKLTGSEKIISVGKTALLKSKLKNFDYASLKNDGFFFKTLDNNLYIDGAGTRGAIYGVYDFLEKIIGIRFFTQDYTYVPKINELPLYKCDVSEITTFDYRVFFSYGILENNPFYTRLRSFSPEINVSAEYGGNTDWYTAFNTIHNAFYWVSDSYYAEHPEYFSRDINNTPIAGNGNTPSQLCLTNGITDDGKLDTTCQESVMKIALESLKGFILDDPDKSFYFFGQNDYNTSQCQCQKCLDAEKAYGGQSGITIRFLNALSDEIQKWLTEKGIKRKIRLGTFSYGYTELAPVKKVDDKTVPVDPTVVPRDNVFIRIAPINMDFYYNLYDEKQVAIYRSQFADWVSLTGNVMVWTYELPGDNLLWYFPSWRTWRDNLLYFKKVGMTYVFMEGNYNGYGSWQTEMQTYVGSKLLWNPNRSVSELIDEFITGVYGDIGGKYVRELMDLLDNHYAILSSQSNLWDMKIFSSNFTNKDYYPVKLVEKAIKIVKDGITKVENSSLSASEKEIILRRLNSVLLTPEYMKLKNYNDYYDSGRTQYAIEFFEKCETMGVQRIDEFFTMDQVKARYGL